MRKFISLFLVCFTALSLVGTANADTFVPGGLSNTTYSGGYGGSGSTTGSVDVGGGDSGGSSFNGTIDMQDNGAGYYFSCSGMGFTQGSNGANIQNNGAHVGITSATAFANAYPTLYQKILSAPSTGGVHFYTDPCGTQFSLDESIAKDQFKHIVKLSVPWNAKKQAVWNGTHSKSGQNLSAQYCPGGNGNQEIVDPSNAKYIGNWEWEIDNDSPSVSLTFGCAGDFKITNVADGKSSTVDHPVPPSSVTIPTTIDVNNPTPNPNPNPDPNPNPNPNPNGGQNGNGSGGTDTLITVQ